MRAFLLHPYQVQFPSLSNQGVRAMPLFVHCYKYAHHLADVFMSSEKIRYSCVSARDMPKMLGVRQLVKETK